MNKKTLYAKKYLIGLITCMSIIGLVGCSQSASFQNTTPVKIGVSVSTSGDFAADGKALEQGYQLWEEAVNGRGGLLGRPVQFDFMNDNSTPEQVAANYHKLISVNHDDLVAGPFSTSLTIAASPVVKQSNYAFVEGAGVAPKVFAAKYDNLFSVSLPATNYLKSFVYYILSLPQSLRPKTVAYASNDDFFTQPQIDSVRTLLDQGGVQSVFYDIYPAATTNYTPIAQKLVQAHPDIVILGTDGQQDSVAFMKYFKQKKFNPSAIIATAGPDQGTQFTKPLGGNQSVEGIFVPNGGWFPTVNNYQNSQFVKDYLAKYGGAATDISADTVEAYSVGQVIEQAVTKAHSLDNTKLIEELHADIFNTLQGAVKFASDGQNSVAAAFLFQWQNGKLIVVFPSSSAAANPEFPKKTWP
ncbi:MAG: amino acid ABC transporter substrate-binding protein [Ktedonobacteraceae bacterium]|nr:amino acid ABC transporter substrate-binding protein [Ktedonobacteraceae bacterium]